MNTLFHLSPRHPLLGRRRCPCAFPALLGVAILLLSVQSCNKVDPEKAPFLSTTTYIGVVSVLYEGETYDNPDIRVDITVDSEDGTLEIFIHKIKFVPRMPVRVDVKVPGVSCIESSGEISFSGDDIVPFSGILPMAKYNVKGLSGTISGKECSFSLNFGDYPTSFTGTAQTN